MLTRRIAKRSLSGPTRPRSVEKATRKPCAGDGRRPPPGSSCRSDSRRRWRGRAARARARARDALHLGLDFGRRQRVSSRWVAPWPPNVIPACAISRTWAQVMKASTPSTASAGLRGQLQQRRQRRALRAGVVVLARLHGVDDRLAQRGAGQRRAGRRGRAAPARRGPGRRTPRRGARGRRCVAQQAPSPAPARTCGRAPMKSTGRNTVAGHARGAQHRPGLRVGVDPAVVERDQARRPLEAAGRIRGVGEVVEGEHLEMRGAAPPGGARRSGGGRRWPGATRSGRRPRRRGRGGRSGRRRGRAGADARSRPSSPEP